MDFSWTCQLPFFSYCLSHVPPQHTTYSGTHKGWTSYSKRMPSDSSYLLETSRGKPWSLQWLGNCWLDNLTKRRQIWPFCRRHWLHWLPTIRAERSWWMVPIWYSDLTAGLMWSHNPRRRNIGIVSVTDWFLLELTYLKVVYLPVNYTHINYLFHSEEDCLSIPKPLTAGSLSGTSITPAGLVSRNSPKHLTQHKQSDIRGDWIADSWITYQLHLGDDINADDVRLCSPYLQAFSWFQSMKLTRNEVEPSGSYIIVVVVADFPKTSTTISDSSSY